MPHSSSVMFVSDPDGTLVNMVKTSVNVLNDADAQEILNCLNDKVYPRIRLALISAKNATSTDTGINVFLGAERTLENLNDDTVQQEIDAKLDKILDGILLQEPVYQVAAAMCAGYLLLASFQAVDFLYKTGWDLIKQANKDLADLTNGPLYKQAVDALVSTKTTTTEAVPQLYLAPAADPATYDATTRTATCFAGAQEDGTAKLWFGQNMVATDVAMGDTYLDILYKLLMAYRNYQNNLTVQELPLLNLVMGVDEGAVGTRSFNLELTDGGGVHTYVPARMDVAMGYFSFHALMYDNSLDAQALTLELGTYDASGIQTKAGIDGIVYGTSASYALLTSRGPHSLILDVKTGKTTTVAQTTTATSKMLTDTFYFQLRPEPGVATFTVTGPLMLAETLAVKINAKTYTYTSATDNNVLYLADIAAKLTRDSALLFGSKLEATLAGDTVTLTWYAAASADATLAVTLTSATATLAASDAAFLGYHTRETLSVDGTFKYRTGPLSQLAGATSPAERIVPVTAGATLLEALQRFVDDLYANQNDLRLAAAMRSPVLLTPEGMPAEVPSVQFVPFLIDSVNAKIVFDLITVPDDVIFAPRPAAMVANQLVFDNRSKSLVLDPVIFKRAGTSGTAVTPATTAVDGFGQARYAAPATTALMERIQQFDRQNGRFW